MGGANGRTTKGRKTKEKEQVGETTALLHPAVSLSGDFLVPPSVNPHQPSQLGPTMREVTVQFGELEKFSLGLQV